MIRHANGSGSVAQVRRAADSTDPQDAALVESFSHASSAAFGALWHVSRAFWQARMHGFPGPKQAANFFARLFEHELVQPRYDATLDGRVLVRHSLVERE